MRIFSFRANDTPQYKKKKKRNTYGTGRGKGRERGRRKGRRKGERGLDKIDAGIR